MLLFCHRKYQFSQIESEYTQIFWQKKQFEKNYRARIVFNGIRKKMEGLITLLSHQPFNNDRRQKRKSSLLFQAVSSSTIYSGECPVFARKEPKTLKMP